MSKSSKQVFGIIVLFVLCLPATPFAEGDSLSLAEQVTIRRTEYGVPHILAENERAAGFGMGYCQAEDHAENIMRRILAARGEQAAHFGDVDKNVEEDFRNRQFRVQARAIETYHLLDRDWRDLTEGYAAGFSYYVALHRDALPNWVQPISGHDVAAHGLTGVARFAFDRGGIIEKFKTKLEEGDETVVEPEDMGSNVWAFDPDRTKSGNAILMGNPHQPWSPVATYYEGHITIPGKYNFYGSTFVGRPVFTTGFNEHLGWSHTVNYPDLEEIYELDLDPARSDHYLFDGGSVPLRSEVATLKIKMDSGYRFESRTYWYSPLGPVIHRTHTKAYVLRSAAYDEFRFYQQWYRLGQSKSFEEYRAVLDTMAIPMFNIGYADREGNIYYLWNGTIPDMPHAAHTDVAVHAGSTEDIWTEFHTLSELPQLLNPKGGYICNSNSTPYLTNLFEPMDRDSFPSHFPNSRMSLRSQHSLHLIHNDKKFDLDEVVAMKFSLWALLTDRVKDDLIAIVNEDLLGKTMLSTPAGDIAGALRAIENWDNRLTRDSRGSVLFQTWWDLYSDGRERDQEALFSVPWSEDDPIETPRGIKDRTGAAEAFQGAMVDLFERYGTWDVTWGDVHRMRFGGLDIPVGGGGHDLGAFRVVLYEKAEDGKFVARSGDSWVFAVEFGETPKAFTIVAYSQSEIEGTPHFADQAPLYAANRMKRAAFTEAEIQATLLKSYHPGEE